MQLRLHGDFCSVFPKQEVDIPALSTIASGTKRKYIHGQVRPMNTNLLTTAGPQPLLLRTQRITVYPNLVTQKLFWLQFYYVDKCVFSVHLYTLSGYEVFRKFYHHANYHATHAVQLPRHLMRGVYKMVIKSERINHGQPIVIK